MCLCCELVPVSVCERVCVGVSCCWAAMTPLPQLDPSASVKAGSSSMVSSTELSFVMFLVLA